MIVQYEGSPLAEAAVLYGPVITADLSPHYLTAKVGSNNTGEMTAIAEALSYAIEHVPHQSHLKIRYDSMLAANNAQGIWSP